MRMRQRALKVEVFTHYFGMGFACVKCGERDIRVLHMHHVKGGGNAHRLKIFGVDKYRASGGSAFYEWLKNNSFPKDIEYAPVCGNCHTKILYEEADERATDIKYFRARRGHNNNDNP